VPRKIFGPDKDEVSGHCRILHNKKFRDLYRSPIGPILITGTSRRLRWVGHVARMRETKNA